MATFQAFAENYSIDDREFTLRLPAAEALCLVSLIQLSKATTDPKKFEKVFPGLIGIAKGIIDLVSEVNQEAGNQLRRGWQL